MPKEIFHIAGMHCKSCEVLLENELRKLDDVQKCEVSHRSGSAEVRCVDAVPRQKIIEIIKRCGYQVVTAGEKNRAPQSKKTWRDYLQIILIIIGVTIGAFLINKIEIAKFFPDFGSQVNVMIALLLGVVASLSTCLVLVGGIVLSFGNMYPVPESAPHPFWNRALPHVYFHVGRIGGFILLGGILGLVGSKLNYSVAFTGYFTIVIALVMLYIGLQILGILPNITKLGFHLPKRFSHRVHQLQASDHHLAPILIGALTFFLPCGFTQSMQLAAVASGNFFAGAAIMGAFALGTLPALLAVGIGSSYAKKQKFNLLNRVIGVIIIFFALYSLNSGLVLTGSSFTLDFWKNGNNATVPASVTDNNSTNDAIQTVKMNVDWDFNPTEFQVKKGVPVRWEITGINITGCSNEVVIPKLGLSKKLKEGLNVLEFTPTESGNLPFSCGMGMLNGHFIVTD